MAPLTNTTALLIASLAMASTASADDVTWDGTGTSIWLDPENWLPFGAPEATDTAVFPPNVIQRDIDLGGNFVEVEALRFESNTNDPYALFDGTLILHGGSIHAMAGGTTHQIHCDIDLFAAGAFDVNGVTRLELLAPIHGGSVDVVKGGGGTLFLGADNSFTGRVTVANGVLEIGDLFALAENEVLVGANGTLDLSSLGSDDPRLGGLGGAGVVELGSSSARNQASLDTIFDGMMFGDSTSEFRQDGPGEVVLAGSGDLGMLRADDGHIVIDGGDYQLAQEAMFVDLSTMIGGGGDVTIRGGATVTEAADFSAGIFQDGSMLTVTDPGTVLTLDRLDCGEQSSADPGHFIISNGAHVDVDDVDNGYFFVGHAGTGTLTLQSGATIASRFAAFSGGETGSGTAVITGPSTTWDTAEMWFGGRPEIATDGHANVRVEDGASVDVDFASFFESSNVLLFIDGGHYETEGLWTRDDTMTPLISLVDPDGGAPALTLDGWFHTYRFAGTLDGPGTLMKEGDAEQIFVGSNTMSGTMLIGDGTVVVDTPTGWATSSAHVVVGNFAKFKARGTLGNAVELWQEGALIVGTSTDSTTSLEVNGVTSDDGQIRLQLGGTVAGDSHDQLVSSVTGNTIVKITRVDGFVAQPGDSFHIIAGDVSGMTPTFDYPNDGLSWSATVDEFGLTIHAAAACQGDFNGDGMVDVADLLILLGAYGNGSEGDINGDGETDVTDMLELIGLWGAC